MPDPHAPPADADPASATPERLLAEALSFLGHDVREGHTSILALIELQRLRDWPASAAELAPRLEAVSRAALAAVDEFLQLVAVLSRTPALEPVDWAEAWHEAWAECGPSARRRGVRLMAVAGPETLPGTGDRVLLGRLLGGLIEGAIERSPAGSELGATLRATASGVAIELDRIAPEAEDAAAARAAAQESRRSVARRILDAAALRLGATVRIDASPPAGLERTSLSASGRAAEGDGPIPPPG